MLLPFRGYTQARVDQGLQAAKERVAANGGTKRPTPGPAVPASQALQGLKDPDVRLPDEFRKCTEGGEGGKGGRYW